MYYITVKLNNKGKQVCNTDTKVFEFDNDTVPTEEQINNIINEQFLFELVENVESVKQSFESVRKGDLLRVVTPGENDLSYEIGEVIYVFNKEFTVCVKFPNSYYDKEYRFNLRGTQIGGDRKYKKYVELPSDADIIKYNNNIHKQDIYIDTINLLLGEDRPLDDLYNLDLPDYITVDDIVSIKEILVKAKEKYDHRYDN